MVASCLLRDFPGRRLVAVAAAVLLVAAGGCANVENSGPRATAEAGTCSYPVSGSPARPVDPPPTKPARKGTVTATMKMAAGTVTITMDRAKAPCTVNNFESLAVQHYFDDTSCHRLTDKSGLFVLQCGDPSGTGSGGPGYSFADELTGQETYPAAVVAMANHGANTNGSQFFIVWAESELEPNYTVFGTIDQPSLEVIQSIASQGVDAANGTSPIADASITSVVMG